jgi:peptidoglycan-associated lipoprotein
MDENQVLNSSIAVSVNSGSQWGPPMDVKGLEGDFIAKHPVLGELFGSEVLFFTANMAGGYGGNDVYYAEKISIDNYATPVNLGPVINTAGNDETPFYKDGVLYFSSTGHPGMGGYDIFQSSWDGSRWSAPENMGRGYNSSYNDRYFSLGADGESGYITSNRPATGTRAFPYKTCCDDISYFTLRAIEIQLLATVFEKDQPILGSEVKLIEMIEEDYGPATLQTSTESNEFSFNLGLERAYSVVASADGYYSDTLEVNSVGLVDSYVFNRKFDLKPIPKEPDVRIITINEPIRMNNIYYDFDDDKILLDAEKDLNFIKGLMEQYPDMVVELGSHTDSQGRDKYNEDLSKRRADSAKRWLARNGIAASRVKAVGYGERVILNKCVNGVKCTDDEHRFNRRTEFKILSGPTSIEIKKEVKGGLEDPSNDKTGSSLGLYEEDFKLGRSYKSINPTYAKITFEKSFHDFGIIRKGEKKTHEFKFTNTGKAPLVIETASACECTEVEWPEKPIKPGGKGVIKATYDSTDKEGEQEVNIDIIANVKTLVVEARFRVFVK